MWRITFERMNDANQWEGKGSITFTSDYTIASDLTEWVKVEIDPNGGVELGVPLCPVCQMQIDECSGHVPPTQ